MDSIQGEEEGVEGNDGIEMSVDGRTSLLIDLRDFEKSEQLGDDRISSDIVDGMTAAEGAVFLRICIANKFSRLFAVYKILYLTLHCCSIPYIVA